MSNSEPPKLSDSEPPKLSDFTIRRARLEDYQGFMRISAGLYWGTDTIPAQYREYLLDPTRVFYVVIYKQHQLVSDVTVSLGKFVL